jgi:predicted GIY-YIG superfamily endonuclease
MGRPFYAYVLLCSDGSYYTGHTDDLEKRVAEHQHGLGSRYTARRTPVSLVWSEAFADRDQATAVEGMIKGWTRAKKQALIMGDFEAISVLARKTNWGDGQ